MIIIYLLHFKGFYVKIFPLSTTFIQFREEKSMIYDNYPESLLALSQMCKDSYAIPQKAFETSNVKRGLRNSDGSGVVAGVTNLGLVHGYVLYEGEKRPDEGKLFYRG